MARACSNCSRQGMSKAIWPRGFPAFCSTRSREAASRATGSVEMSTPMSGTMTSNLFPKQSQYSLVVMTFDREKKVPTKILYYQETLNNLVKMRRDGSHVFVGRRWVPTTITMQNLPLRTESRLELRWTQSPPVPPELFQPAFLARPSSLKWPEPAAPPGSVGN